MRFLKIIRIVLFLLAVSPLLRSQTTTGSISGIVHDAQDAVIANASVTVTEQDRKTVAKMGTDVEGRFVFPQMAPGRYAITVEAPGFKKLERNVVLHANDKLSAGIFTLEIGAVEQTVEVTAEIVALKTESSERSEAVTANQLQGIAVNSRSYLQLAGIVPGVVFTGNLTTGGHAGLANISANGARFDQNQLTLNGIGNVDTGNNGDQLATISLDAVQEFKMLTANYQAEYGRSSGAQINVVTKNGSSDFHGSGYLFHRHEGLNANNWKNNRDGLARQKFRFNDPGYTIGGPVYIPGKINKNKDKLFFFWSQEFQRQLRPQGRRDVTMPTALEREGDFSQSVDRNGNLFNTIRDPLSGQPCTSSNRAGCFADGGVLGRIPKSRLYGPGVALLKALPLPNNPGNRGFNFSSQISDSYPRREDLIRIDANISSKWRVFGHYLNNFDSVTSAYGSFVLGFNFPLVPITDTRPGRSMVLSAVTVINPTTTNEVTWGFGHNQINIDPVNDGLKKSKLGLSDIPLLYPGAVQNDFIPRFGYNGSRITNSPTIGTNNAPFFNYNTTIDWIDNFSKIWNQHVFKAGVYIQRSRKDQTSFAASSGDFNFGDSSTNPLDTGFGIANAAVGVFSSFNQASVYATGMYRYTNVEWYMQDQWRLTRRLTLDYGMRFYWLQPQYDAALQTSTFLSERYDRSKSVRLFRPAFDANGVKIAVDPVTGQTRPVTDIGKIVSNSGNPINGIAKAGTDFSRYLMQNRGVHYSPRFGFAYDVTGEQKIVVRGGGAILYDRFQGNEVFDMLTNPPTTVAPTLVNGLISGINPKDVLLAPVGLNAFSPDGKVPTVYSYSFGIQTRLPHAFVLDTSYVGSQSRHQLQRLNINAIAYGATFRSENQDPTKVRANANAVLGSNAFDADFLRPFPGYGNITVHQMGGTANYNSLQVGLNRRLGSSLFVTVAYTWSKALGTTGDRGGFHRIDNLTRFANYGPIGLDRRHNLGINYTYTLPMFSRHIGDYWLVHNALDGWQVSGFTRFQSGGPYGVGFSIPGIGSPQLTGSYTEGARVKLIGNPLTGTSDDPYRRLNPAAFTTPPVGTIGLDAPTNYLTGPGFNNWDISLQKEFVSRERFRLQLRADAFNAFNHTQFSGINSGINFTSLTNSAVTNLPFTADGSLRDKNGFGTVSGARDPRIMQLMVRVQF